MPGSNGPRRVRVTVEDLDTGAEILVREGAGGWIVDDERGTRIEVRRGE